MKVEIIPAESWHGSYVSERMRQADRDEVFAMSGRTASQAMEYSLARSDYAMAGLVDGVPICLFGVGSLSLLCGVGVPWLLGTDEVEKNYRVFAKNSKSALVDMIGRYSKLINAVDDRNELSKRWLAWLGFKIGEPKIMGVSKLPFRIFEIEEKKHV